MKNNKNTPFILGVVLVILFYFIGIYLKTSFNISMQFFYLLFLLLILPILFMWIYQKIKRKDIFLKLTLLLVSFSFIYLVLFLVRTFFGGLSIVEILLSNGESCGLAFFEDYGDCAEGYYCAHGDILDSGGFCTKTIKWK